MGHHNDSLRRCCRVQNTELLNFFDTLAIASTPEALAQQALRIDSQLKFLEPVDFVLVLSSEDVAALEKRSAEKSPVGHHPSAGV